MACIDTVRCDRYDDLCVRFAQMGGWNGPVDMKQELTADELRAWWDSHGCVRCWIEARDKMDHGKWSRICKNIGPDQDGDDQYVMGNPQIVDEIAAAISNWMDPGCRKTGRFYCQPHVQLLRSGCTLWNQFPLDAGHVGWFYALPKPWQTEPYFNNFWRIGDKDALNTSYGSWRTILDGGFECTPSLDDDSLESLQAELVAQEYSKMKLLWALDGNFEEAYLVAKKVIESMFSPFNNCNTAAQAVLTAFGADLVPSAYLLGDYFAAIQVPAIDIPVPGAGAWEMKSMSPTNAKRSKRSKLSPVGGAARSDVCLAAQGRGRARKGRRAAAAPAVDVDPPLVDAVYLTGPKSAVHLTLECPALDSAKGKREEYGIVDTDDLNQIAADFNAPVCGTCVRLMEASSRVVLEMEMKEGTLQFCHSRLRLLMPTGEIDLMFERITGYHRKVLTFTPAVVVKYRIPLPEGVVAKREISLEFSSDEERDNCLTELSECMSSW